ncbi:hypothetical protein GLW08_11945 [Pontibacillus yanchengensis]|uniref:Uncharacterized protein n=1 Tax=Pontibacillus yanchengensis TaxID=462910 RepID=A0ACC7VIN0_9BACI|nr:hypothetical protein [Pontibacillus yanchengensis]MYL54049.1 hypothetical protein [Pontibacillus yanchengensis]
MKKWIGITLVIITFFLTPLLWWLVEPNEKLDVLLVDKTVPDDSYREHKGLTWLLNHKNFTQNDGSSYSNEEYIGVKPKGEDKYSYTPFPDQLQDHDMIYVADTYGQHQGTLLEKNNKENYGGLSYTEVEKMRRYLFKNPSTLVAEFNTFGNPTDDKTRKSMESLLNVEWTGWTGRYFTELNPNQQSEVPNWVVEQYRKTTGESWDYSGAGYVLVHEDNRIVVLKENEDVNKKGLTVDFSKKGQSFFNLKESPAYMYWFDIIEPASDEEVMANYNWGLKESGKNKLEQNGIPFQFPAVTKTTQDGFPAYYFAGDFVDTANVPPVYRYKGISTIRQHLSFGFKKSPQQFYWETYVPMMETILAETDKESESKKTQSSEAYHENDISYPTRVSGNRFEIYQNGEWSETVIKGVNIGMGKPGAFPGEAAISEQEYARWFKQIGEMNATAIRVYTIHPPGFYRALKRYNAQAENPIYIFHGAWVDEKPLEETLDAFSSESVNGFKNEIETIVDVIHGNKEIPEKPGHASGNYTADVSQYVAGWILGIEWYPYMVENTNKEHQDIGQFDGDYVYTEKASPFEHWLAEMMEHTISYEMENYKWQRPISFTNWVTTDLLDHPMEPSEEEDLVGVDPNVINMKDTFKPGTFASYHVYPYYPDFMNYSKDYLNYEDHRGEKNSYAGYLHDLKNAHDMPVLVAEFGVPSSRGMTHKNPYGWNQGNLSEKQQGNINKHLFEDIMHEGYMGGLVFTWQDEWFKRTWNTMELDDPNRRPSWSNTQTNEQQFGLLSFDRHKQKVDGKGKQWSNEPLYEDDNTGTINRVTADHDERYLYMRFQMGDSFSFEEENLTIGLDTIQNQGQLQVVNNVKSKQGIDFKIEIQGKEQAEMKVDSYYDPFYYQYGDQLNMIEEKDYASQNNNGTFHPIRLALNKEMTIPVSEETIPFSSYKTGVLTHGNGNPKSEQYNSLTDYSIEGNTLEIRIPWLMLNVKDPSQRTIMTNLWEEGLKGSEELDEIGFSFITHDKDGSVTSILPSDGENQIGDFYTYSWEKWNQPKHQERLKKSYYIMQDVFSDYE